MNGDQAPEDEPARRGSAGAAPAAPRLPLSGLVVVDLTHARAGPTCVRHLADWGAEVIRIDPPASQVSGIDEDVVGNQHGADYLNLHRNKRSIRLDLKRPEGHAVFMRLVEKADVVVENMRAAAKHRLGVSWDDVRAVNPRIVYGSISGFGQDGPYADRAGVDQVVQGMGGLMSITGIPGQGPLRVGIPVADLSAGNLLALAIMIALYERERTGQGRWVSTSLLESQVFMLDFQAARWLVDGIVPGQAGNDHPTGIPTGMFEASDGHLNIAASSSRMWRRLCAALGRPEWATVEEWATQAGRSRDRQQINRLINEVTRTACAAHWIALLNDAGVPCGPIYSVDQVFGDPQVRHVDMVRAVDQGEGGSKRLVASPINLDGVSKDIRLPTPVAGQHAREILEWLGYDEAQIDSLRASGVL